MARKVPSDWIVCLAVFLPLSELAVYRQVLSPSLGTYVRTQMIEPIPLELSFSGPSALEAPPWMLKEMRAVGVSKVVVHTLCLGCVLTVPPEVSDAFSQADVLNIVAAKDKDAYRDIANSHQNCHVLFVDLAQVHDLQPVRSPMSYHYDKYGNLTWYQKN